MNEKGQTEPEIKKSAQAKKPKANTNSPKSKGAVLGFFVFLTFIVAVAGIGAGYYFWQQIQQDLKTAQSERAALERALNNVDENPRIQQYKSEINRQLSKANETIQSFEDKLDKLNSQQTQLTAAIQETSDFVNRSQIGWMLKEVEHVLRMAQHRLLLDRDFHGALLGLNAADRRLNDINDVRLIPVRESIAMQIRTLKQFSHPDYVGIQLKLDNTIAQLRTGLLRRASKVTEDSLDDEVMATESPSTQKSKEKFSFDVKRIWTKVRVFVVDTLQRAKVALSDSVRITRGEQKIALFIEEQEKKRAYDFLRQKLLGAKYAVSTRDDLSFHQQLNAAVAWLESNDEFINKQALIKDIKELDSNDLLPALPDISQPSERLKKYLESVKE